ncbi:hypothetical protein F5Y07DRAFT_70132 [Xylaria sp. FL0933]|nr:hypothetical protein F5Y07DRAFT_70132 [Xylaria sp. FL0933]
MGSWICNGPRTRRVEMVALGSQGKLLLSIVRFIHSFSPGTLRPSRRIWGYRLRNSLTLSLGSQCTAIMYLLQKQWRQLSINIIRDFRFDRLQHAARRQLMIKPVPPLCFLDIATKILSPPFHRRVIQSLTTSSTCRRITILRHVHKVVLSKSYCKPGIDAQKTPACLLHVLAKRIRIRNLPANKLSIQSSFTATATQQMSRQLKECFRVIAA